MLDYSHFISLPLAVHSDLIQKLMKFQSTILGETQGYSGKKGHYELDSQSISLQLEVEERKDQVKVEIAERVAGSGSTRTLSGTGS
jgi:activating signal cointegrator complex subunit 1